MKLKKEKWPSWTVPSDNEQILLARILLSYIKILSRDIINLLVDENNKKFEEWTQAFNELGIRADIYLWFNSPVAFPGIRRHVGSNEIYKFKKSPELAFSHDALHYEDNSFPKEIWSFSLKNCKHDKTNPLGYSLAHIVDHKDYKSRHEDELIGFSQSNEKNLFAGLYTSSTNSVYVPNSLLKPTDHKGNLRRLIIQIVETYYSPICTLLPYNLSFKLDDIEDKWKLYNFPPPTEVGNFKYAKNFIRYRNKIIDNKINDYRQQMALQRAK